MDNTNETGALDHANSACAASGLMTSTQQTPDRPRRRFRPRRIRGSSTDIRRAPRARKDFAQAERGKCHTPKDWYWHRRLAPAFGRDQPSRRQTRPPRVPFQRPPVAHPLARPHRRTRPDARPDPSRTPPNAGARKSSGDRFVGRGRGFTDVDPTGTAALDPTRRQMRNAVKRATRLILRAEDELREAGRGGCQRLPPARPGGVGPGGGEALGGAAGR